MDRLIAELRRRQTLRAADPTVELPYLVVIVDEFMGIETRQLLDLFRLGRELNIRLVLATQKPSADAVATAIKMNIRTRIAFQVRASYESRLILGDRSDATCLRGKGDCFVACEEDDPVRVQGALVTDARFGPKCDLADLARHLGGEPAPDETPDVPIEGEPTPVVADALPESGSGTEGEADAQATGNAG